MLLSAVYGVCLIRYVTVRWFDDDDDEVNGVSICLWQCLHVSGFCRRRTAALWWHVSLFCTSVLEHRPDMSLPGSTRVSLPLLLWRWWWWCGCAVVWWWILYCVILCQFCCINPAIMAAVLHWTDVWNPCICLMIFISVQSDGIYPSYKRWMALNSLLVLMCR